ncbi:MAG: glycine C-acetyltransferase [Gammaproteobacteria bacterium]|nr:glycine C-acetyltransferase [Gammaproteobacteria bacterium]
MPNKFYDHLTEELKKLQENGLYKQERIITSPQAATIKTSGGIPVINMCANNYLGLANHPDLVATAKKSLDTYGFGLSSVRFICGTQNIHKELEKRMSKFLGMEDTILYSSCFDANGGLFETILDPEDAIISDSLNHASIIDGIRLCKAQRFRYSNNDMADLELKLKEANNCRYKMIVTDGVFSMDGTIANLPAICELAGRYNAMVIVDDSHAVGFMGEKGKGTPEYHNVMDKVDIITGTLGKALGGASGGYTSGKKEVIDWLRQKSRPYLFSNTLAPVIAATSIKVLDLLETSDDLRLKLKDNAAYFRKGLTELGFNIVPGTHPIIPVMLGEARLAKSMADKLLDEGIYVISFSYPVVPQGKARIRTQVSAAHSREQLDKALNAFSKIGKALEIIN